MSNPVEESFEKYFKCTFDMLVREGRVGYFVKWLRSFEGYELVRKERPCPTCGSAAYRYEELEKRLERLEAMHP